MLSQRYFYVNAAYFSSIVRFCTDICPETNVATQFEAVFFECSDVSWWYGEYQALFGTY